MEAAPGHKQRQAASPPRKKRKRGGEVPADLQVRNDIVSAAKHQDPALALRAFDRAAAEGINLRPDSYNTLLFLCAGGDRWQERFRSLPIPWPAVRQEAKPPAQPDGANGAAEQHANGTAASKADAIDARELMRRGSDVLQHMRSASVGGLNEMAYTGLARIAAASGDGGAAFQAAKDGQAAKVPARLRTFLPALLAFAEAGDVSRTFEVAEAMTSLELDWTETEYAALLLASRHGATKAQVESVLDRLGRELTTLAPETLRAAEAFFRSDGAACLLAEGERWRVEECDVAADGVTSTCGGRVQRRSEPGLTPGAAQALDLSAEEMEAFAEAIAGLAKKNERKPDGFVAFQRWLEEHGPFEAVLDGANIAYFGQNFAQGGFQFSQIGDAVDTVAHVLPGQKALVVLHARRLKDKPAAVGAAPALIERLQAQHSLFATPYGSNDDWYWMYAAVRAGPNGFLVSNDEMRDHVFQLLAPKFFLKWKQRHQMRYKFAGRGMLLTWPAAYTACTQRLATGSWVLPAAASSARWLCARPVKAE